MRKDNKMLLNLLVVSSVMVGMLGAFLKYGVLQTLGIHREENIMAIPFVFLKDDMLSYEVNAAYEKMVLQNIADSEGAMIPTEQIPAEQPPTEATEPIVTEEVMPTETQPPETLPVETVPPTEPAEIPETEPAPVYQPVDESWFDDALFIGDSRTVGLRDYARLGDADYFCAVSMSVFNVMEWETFDEDFTYDTLDEVLQSKQYGKIYIHLGLNEVGRDKTEILLKYQELLDMIRLYQPEAKIILQAMMSVSRDRAQSEYFSLENIQTLNGMICSLAEEQGLLFEDVNTLIADEEGYMFDELTFDGCHLYGKGYLDWRQWIWDSAGWYGIP